MSNEPSRLEREVDAILRETGWSDAPIDRRSFIFGGNATIGRLNDDGTYEPIADIKNADEIHAFISDWFRTSRVWEDHSNGHFSFGCSMVPFVDDEDGK